MYKITCCHNIYYAKEDEIIKFAFDHLSPDSFTGNYERCVYIQALFCYYKQGETEKFKLCNLNWICYNILHYLFPFGIGRFFARLKFHFNGKCKSTNIDYYIACSLIHGQPKYFVKILKSMMDIMSAAVLIDSMNKYFLRTPKLPKYIDMNLIISLLRSSNGKNTTCWIRSSDYVM